MRSFVALMTCIGCIAWIHSCEKRLLGVRIEKNSLTPNDQPQQLPIAILPDNIAAHYISQVTVNTPVSVLRPRNKARAKKQPGIISKTAGPLLLNFAMVKGQYSMYNNTTP